MQPRGALARMSTHARRARSSTPRPSHAAHKAPGIAYNAYTAPSPHKKPRRAVDRYSVLRVPLSPELATYLDDLRQLGFLGSSRLEVALALLRQRVQRETDFWEASMKHTVPRLK